MRVGDLTLDTTGALGVWSRNGQLHDLAFPSWTTIPSTYNLALSRHWHLTFAWLLVGAILLHGIWSLINGHLRRDLAPRPDELKPGHILEDITYGMNGADLPTSHGAPLRLRVERQLGYKQAKFIMRAEAVASAGYYWYAGA